MSIDIYTKTIRQKVKNGYVEKLYGVIEGPIGLMMQYHPTLFKFLRHQKKSKTKIQKKTKSDEQ
tara:strand:+ start:327 stop:518 length:192 start_codon:yes stop_codon:yes gene_type:complete